MLANSAFLPYPQLSQVTLLSFYENEYEHSDGLGTAKMAGICENPNQVLSAKRWHCYACLFLLSLQSRGTTPCLSPVQTAQSTLALFPWSLTDLRNLCRVHLCECQSCSSYEGHSLWWFSFRKHLLSHLWLSHGQKVNTSESCFCRDICSVEQVLGL